MQRRSPYSDDDGGAWLLQNEARVTDLLTTLGTVGPVKLQQTILAKFVISIGHQPLETFIDRQYGSDRQSSIVLHNNAMTAASSSGSENVLDQARPIYAKLRGLFLDTSRTIEAFTRLLKQFAIVYSSSAATNLFVRMQWGIEAQNEFCPAMGRDKHQGSQEP